MRRAEYPCGPLETVELLLEPHEIITIANIGVSAKPGLRRVHRYQLCKSQTYIGRRRLLVQTEPRPDIIGLNCSSDYWLKLSNTYSGYDSMLSILLAAQLANKTVLVRAVDDAGTDFVV